MFAVVVFLRMEEPAAGVAHDLIASKHELWEEKVAVRIVDFLAREVASEAVFAIVIEAVAWVSGDGFFWKAIGSKLLALVDHDEFGRIPRLSRTADVTPELRFPNVEAAGDEVITTRLCGDGLVAGVDLLLHRGIGTARENKQKADC